MADSVRQGHPVRMRRTHPHAGRIGILKSYDSKLKMWLVEFDDGHSAYSDIVDFTAMNPRRTP